MGNGWLSLDIGSLIPQCCTGFNSGFNYWLATYMPWPSFRITPAIPWSAGISWRSLVRTGYARSPMHFEDEDNEWIMSYGSVILRRMHVSVMGSSVMRNVTLIPHVSHLFCNPATLIRPFACGVDECRPTCRLERLLESLLLGIVATGALFLAWRMCYSALKCFNSLA